MNTLRDGVVCTVRIGAALIADEDHLEATVLKLLQVRRCVPHIHDALECPEVVHHWLPPLPHLKRSHAINALRWTSIQDIQSGVHRLTPEPSGLAIGLQHALGGCHHHPVPMLDDIILLSAVRCRVLTMHTLSRTIVREFYRGELASTVGGKCLQLEAGLTLCPRLDVLDGSHCTILGRNHSYPHVPAEIIHKQQKILVTPWRCL
jgi:hypothetical protein